MKIKSITFTGADDNTDPRAMLELSRAFPLIEWGVLLSSKDAGSGRYPSNAWLRRLESLVADEYNRYRDAHTFRLAAHLCGDTMRGFMSGMTFSNTDSGAWILAHGLTEEAFNIMFQRTQLNFNAKREGFTPEHFEEVLDAWVETMSGTIITQHNPANADVWEHFQKAESKYVPLRAHQVLHDASGGRGKLPATWQKPIAGVLTGYSGGLALENVIESLEKIETQVGDGYIWIDMESCLRDENDRFDLDKAGAIAALIEGESLRRGWI
jgi:hypothetical protein